MEVEYVGNYPDSEYIVKGCVNSPQFLGWKFELAMLSGVESINPCYSNSDMYRHILAEKTVHLIRIILYFLSNFP
jgi:hypothetical protein